MLADKLELNDSKTEFTVFVDKFFHDQSFIHAKSLVLILGEAEGSQSGCYFWHRIIDGALHQQYCVNMLSSS